MALLAEQRALACTMPAGVSAKEFYRAQQAQIRKAPIVVEGYVEVRKFRPGERTRLPIARLIVRQTLKGPRRAYYPLNYVPTTCHVPFPTDRAKRQKIYLYGAKGFFHIIHVERLN